MKALNVRNVRETFEPGGKAVRGAVRVVNLRGTWRDMGRQYGALLSDALRSVSAFVERIAAVSADHAAKANEIAASLYRQTPHNIRAFFAGAAETSGLTENQLYRANAVEYISGLPACTAVAAWNGYADGALVFGRNYDYGKDFHEMAQNTVVTVFHPSDGSQAAAIIGYAGEIYAVNGMNESGVFLELNNATPSTRMDMVFTRAQGTTCLFDALFKADTLDDLDIFMETARCSDSYIINAADAREARSYEWCHTGVRRILPSGLLLSTNHYVHPDWDFPPVDDAHSWDSVTRYKNLAALVEKYKGRFNVDTMRDLLDLRFENGGVTDDLTVYQLIAVPEARALWMKVSGASDWTEIDLRSFFAE